MKIGGKKIDHGPATEMLVFPRGEGQIALRATALLDKSEFDRLCPQPKVPKMRARGGKMVENPEDPRYAKMLSTYNEKFLDYLLVAGLSAPAEKEGEPDQPIEWEQVILADSSTWHLWNEELKESGFCDMERKRIYNAVCGVNSLTENRLEEARASFLQRQRQEQDESSSLTDEQTDTPSGEPASDLESDLQESQEAGMIST